ncbi:MAG: LTA synthase family protein [Deltaproteobacteria bacterium]|nr:LTA synthase family protein [Deltaproteobacteria bacterium]
MKMRSFLLRYGVFVLAWLAYCRLADPRTLTFEWTQLLTELPLLLLLYAFLQLPLRHNRMRGLVAALPLVSLYAIHDAVFVSLGTVLCFKDFAELPDLLRHMSALPMLLACLALLAPPALWLAAIDRRARWWRPSNLPVALLASIWFLMVFALPGRTYEWMNRITPDEEWSDQPTAERWGRLYTVFMRDARRLSFLEELDRAKSPAKVGMSFDDALRRRIRPRNVHLIVMESFLDVRLMNGVRFSRPPLDEGFTAWLGDRVSASLSPSFGGETARAEFELLCGVPSLRLYGIEFLAFDGTQAPCLPNHLRRAGYRTVLSFPGGPVYANMRLAYPGLGFAERIFGDHFSAPGTPSLRLDNGDPNLFDGDLFPQNLARVRPLVREGRPFLNYVLTLYGHWPFESDPRRFPDVVAIEPPQAELQRIANQMRYRTAALHRYLLELLKLDPTGIVVVVGDHLPTLPDGERDYRRLGYTGRSGLPQRFPDLVEHETFLLLVVAGQVVKVPLMHHFDVPHWILDQLTDGAYCRAEPALCDFGRLPLDRLGWKERYRAVLAAAAGKSP